MQDTMIVIDSILDDESTGRILRAFDLWFECLDSDPIARRAAQLRFGTATIVTGGEIFGPDAEGGFLVRDSDPAVGRWRLLIAAEGSRGMPRGSYRRGEVLSVVDGDAADRPYRYDLRESGHLLERAGEGTMIAVTITAWLWFGSWSAIGGLW
ncbi:hypothetical protein [Rhodococcus yananensis]|uniref:hypothetical protein n=1 Tax=Rhodococcus yananensis TaxID=2879464 RepID=UPI001CF8B07A|nr:hypothetical protein [Rhodococcus yananensis]